MNAPALSGTIVDPDDFCRSCGGKGRIWEKDYRPGVGHIEVYDDCPQCRGTGRRTILIMEKNDA